MIARMPGSSSAVRDQASATARVEVQRLVGQRPLEAPGEAGVPAQLEGAEQVELVAEGLGDAGHVDRQDPSRRRSAAAITVRRSLRGGGRRARSWSVPLVVHTVGTYSQYVDVWRYAKPARVTWPTYARCDDPVRAPRREARAQGPATHGSRRQQYSASTKRALVDVADELFTEHGYAATAWTRSSPAPGSPRARSTTTSAASRRSSRPSSSASRPTPSRQIKAALRGASDPWEKALAGLRAFLEVVQEPTYQRIVIQDGPGGARLRAVPRAGGALDVRQRPGHRALGARGVDLRARRARWCRPSAGSSSARCRRPARASRPPRTPSRPRPRGSRPRSGSSSTGIRSLAEQGVDPDRPRRRRRARPRAERGSLLEGDVAAVLVGRHQLDPGVPGRHVQRARPWS